MAFTYVRNVTIGSCWDAAFFLKEHLKANGHTVKSSGDGLSAYSATGDILTGINSGANGFGNKKAWFRIQDPNGREFTLQQATTLFSIGTRLCAFRIKYSRAAGFTGGSPSSTQTPSATDEGIVAGGGTDAAPSPHTVGDTLANSIPSFAQFTIGGSAENYGWSVYMYAKGAPTAVSLAWFFDPLNQAQSADTDPFMYRFLNAGKTTFADLNTTSTTPGNGAGRGWVGLGTVDEGFKELSAASVKIGSTGFPLDMKVDPHTGKDQIGTIPIMRTTAMGLPAYVKGNSSMMFWLGQTRNFLTTLNANVSKDYVAIGDIAIKQQDGTDPGV